MPQPVAGDGLREGLAQGAHEVARRRGAAIGHGFEARQRPARLPGGGGELPGDGRHAAGAGAALPVDQVEGLKGVPAMHHHQAMAAIERRPEARVAARDVEQRVTSSEARCGADGSGFGGARPPAQGAARGGIGIGHHRGRRRPVGADRALGRRWCPRCRKQGSRRPRGRGRCRAATGRAGRPNPQPHRSLRRAASPGSSGSIRVTKIRSRAGHSARWGRCARTARPSAISTRAARMLKRVSEFRPGPPGVERRRDRPGQRGRRNSRPAIPAGCAGRSIAPGRPCRSRPPPGHGPGRWRRGRSP